MARVHLSDTMRNIHVKSKSFVVVGFVCVLGFAAFTFWGLSTQNSDFLVKIEQLEDNLKIRLDLCAHVLVSCSTHLKFSFNFSGMGLVYIL